jgi:hypothetical protein
MPDPSKPSLDANDSSLGGGTSGSQMSPDQIAGGMWKIGVIERRPDGSWKIYARPLGTTAEKACAEKSLRSACLNDQPVALVGSPAPKPPA